VIQIAEYDAAWPAMFAAEAALVEPILRPFLVAGIEHIGSTAVPGLAAKPVIDIMAPVESLAASRDAIEALRAAGYLYAPYREDVMHWLCKPGPEVRTHHLHLVPLRSALWNDRIAFRDALRWHPEVAAEYADLKRQLAVTHGDDREAYTEGKGAFVAGVLKTWRERVSPSR
jgi:GrpB-like predicted nucleotidyltransferase (UPF0157 family)